MKTYFGSAGNLLASRVRWRPTRAMLRLRLYALLLVTDWLTLTIAFAAAGMTANRVLLLERDAIAGKLILALYLAIGGASGCYSVVVGIHRRVSATCALRALTLAMITFLLLAFVLKVSSEFSRVMLVSGYLYAAPLLIGARYWIARLAPRLLGGSPWDTILICDGTDDIKAPVDCSMVIHAGDLVDPTVRSPAMFDRLARMIGHADRVLVRCPPERRKIWAAVLRGANVQGAILAPELAELRPHGLTLVDGVPALVVAQGPLRLFQRLVKRSMDIAIVIPAIIALAPILLVIAVAIRTTSAGPVFFAQTRIGRQNRQFTMWKFRSMHVDRSDADGARSTSRDDARVTTVGRFLRRTSLDELPQLFNILAGDMSVVGPRPHALSSTAADLLFWEVDPNYWDRHAIKPGLTGLAQVRGYRGATFERNDLERRLASDMEYIQTWSPQSDLVILARTVFVLLHRNAF